MAHPLHHRVHIRRCVHPQISTLAFTFPFLFFAILAWSANVQSEEISSSTSPSHSASATPAPSLRSTLNPSSWKQLTLKSGQFRFQDFTADAQSFVALAPGGGFALYATVTGKQLRKLDQITLADAASFKFLPPERTQNKIVHYLVGSERELALCTWADHRQTALLRYPRPLRDAGINIDGENPRWSADGRLLGCVQQTAAAPDPSCEYVAYEVNPEGFKEALRLKLDNYSGGFDFHAGRGLLAYKSSPPFTGGDPLKLRDAVILFDLSRNKVLWERRDLPLGSGCVRFSPDGSTLAVCAGQWVLLVDTADPAKLRLDRKAAESCLQWADFSQDGQMLVTASQNSAISFYPVDFGAPAWRPMKTIPLGTSSNIYYLHLFANDQRLLCNTAGSVRIFGEVK